MLWVIALVVCFVFFKLMQKSDEHEHDHEQCQRLHEQQDQLIRQCVQLGMPNPRGAKWAKMEHYWIGGDHRANGDTGGIRNKGASWDWRPLGGLACIGGSVKDFKKSIEELQSLIKLWQEEQKRRDRRARLLVLPTSTTQQLIGRRILKQIRMVRVDGCSTDEEADLDLREAALEAGAGAIINMRVRPYPGGKFSAEGDAVTLQDE